MNAAPEVIKTCASPDEVPEGMEAITEGEKALLDSYPQGKPEILGLVLRTVRAQQWDEPQLEFYARFRRSVQCNLAMAPNDMQRGKALFDLLRAQMQAQLLIEAARPTKDPALAKADAKRARKAQRYRRELKASGR